LIITTKNIMVIGLGKKIVIGSIFIRLLGVRELYDIIKQLNK